MAEEGSVVDLSRVTRKERHESISFDPSSRDKPVTRGLNAPRQEGREV